MGLFTQSGSRNSVSTTLYVGNDSGSYGTYNMQGGALAANQEAIGLTGTGTFTQSGGTHTVIGSDWSCGKRVFRGNLQSQRRNTKLASRSAAVRATAF